MNYVTGRSGASLVRVSHLLCQIHAKWHAIWKTCHLKWEKWAFISEGGPLWMVMQLNTIIYSLHLLRSCLTLCYKGLKWYCRKAFVSTSDLVGLELLETGCCYSYKAVIKTFFFLIQIKWERQPNVTVWKGSFIVRSVQRITSQSCIFPRLYWALQQVSANCLAV